MKKIGRFGLSITESGVHDDGNYQCTANNGYAAVTKETQVHIIGRYFDETAWSQLIFQYSFRGEQFYGTTLDHSATKYYTTNRY